jgi:hypothetical protein
MLPKGIRGGLTRVYPKIFSDYFRDFERSSEVFVAMPFSREAEPRWRSIFSPAIRSLRLRPFRVRQGRVSDSILTDILRAIGRARLLLIDVSFQRIKDRPPGPNPNVLYELGLAHAMRLPEEVIVVRGDKEKVEPPFDISQIRYHRCEFANSSRGRTQVERLLRQAVRSLDATRDLIVERVLRGLDPDSMRFLSKGRDQDSFDLFLFDPDRKGLYGLGGRDTNERYLRALARSLIARGVLEAGDPGPIRRRVYGGTPEYALTNLGRAVASRLPRWCTCEERS